MAHFQEQTLPAHTRLAGWAELASRLGLSAPVRRPGVISHQHVSGSQRQEGNWLLFDRRYWPGNSVADHLAFALRHEPINLLLLKRLFQTLAPREIESIIRPAPTAGLARRIWFLYETMLDRTLDLEDAPSMAAVDILESEDYFIGTPQLSKRHRVRNNLLGAGRSVR